MNDVVVRGLMVAAVLCALPVVLSGVVDIQTITGVETSPAVVAGQTDDNETEPIRHQNPAEYESEGDTAATASWLSDRLGERLGDSAIALEQDEYDLASEYVDEEYYDRLEQYVEVSGETAGGGGGDETNTTQSFEDVAEEQGQLTNQTRQYNETKSEYEAAREAGDEDRARELARELEDLATEINALNESVSNDYENITLETDQDLSEARNAVSTTNERVQQDQTIIREEQFIETELVLESESETISFQDPLTVHGEIQTADGSSPAPDEIQLLVDDESVTTETNDDGTVSFEYRPTTEPLSTETLTVRYIPETQSTYLGSETSVPVSIEQTDLEIQNLEASPTAAYGDNLSVDGEVTATGIPVDDVPLEVTLGEQTLGTVSANDGSFSGSLSVPAAVSNGDRPLHVSFPFEDRALSPTAADQNVTVTETDTELTLEAEWTNTSTVAIDGSFETVAGSGLEEQTVTLQIDEAETETITTDENGSFATNIEQPPETEQAVAITAAYDGAGTNLASATAETTAVPLQSPTAQTSLWTILAAALGIIVVATGVYWWYRTRRRSTTEVSDPEEDKPDQSHSDRQVADEEHLVVRSLLETARGNLSENRPNEAIRACYAAVRAAYDTDVDRPETLTHWEFYRHYRTNATDADHLRKLTEAYEQAAYTPDNSSVEDARRVLELTQQTDAWKTTVGESISTDD